MDEPNEGVRFSQESPKPDLLFEKKDINNDAPRRELPNDDTQSSQVDLYPKNIPENYIHIYNNLTAQVLAMAVPITKSLPQAAINNFKYFNERYFENYYSVNSSIAEKESVHNDILVRVHSNKLILLALAKGHSICNSGKKITEINFIVNNTDRSAIKPKGKRKLGSKAIESETILCQVKLEGSIDAISIRAGVSGYLVEVNELIKKDPNLLINAPTGLGYLGIMMPKGKPVHFKETVNSWDLLSEESYNQCLQKRCGTVVTNGR